MVLLSTAVLGLLVFRYADLTLASTAGSASSSQIVNPILPGFHPDPSCIHVSEHDLFYCASSSFNVFPGIPIHASKDLKNWRLVGNVLNRYEQLPELAASNGSTSGIWAPALRYHEGIFYLVTTMVHDKYDALDPSRWDNIIFQTSDIWDDSAWSNPVHFNFTGYDTSPFWDDDGTSYIVGSHAYHVQPGIHLAEVDLDTGEIQAPWTNLWNGTGGLAPEGPHLYRKDGYYYLMIAEGGTGLGHMETMARSKALDGPYEANPANPILTAANTTNYFQTVGHADLFQDSRGNWWAVALSTRSGPDFVTYPMGRETVLTNVTWNAGEWPTTQSIHGLEQGWPLPPSDADFTDNADAHPLVTAGDNNLTFLPGTTLPKHFVHWRPPVTTNYQVAPKGHEGSLGLKPSWLNLTGLDGNAGGSGGQTFVGRRQVDTLFTYQIDIDYAPKTVGEEAGVTLFLTQNHHARLGLTFLPSNTSSSPIPQLHFQAESSIPVPKAFATPLPESWIDKTLTFQIKAFNATHYSFSAGLAPSGELKEYVLVPGSIVSWGFTGTLLGVYASSNGGNGTTRAYVRNWDYQGQGQITSNGTST